MGKTITEKILETASGREVRAGDFVRFKVNNVLTHKLEVLLGQVEVKGLVLAGGVAANRSLRASAARVAQHRRVRFILPPPEFCTDNGAMVAALGYFHLQAGRRLDLADDAFSRWPRGV